MLVTMLVMLVLVLVLEPVKELFTVSEWFLNI